MATMTHPTRTAPALVAIAAAALCLVPTVGLVLAWQHVVELRAFVGAALLPALLALGACELYLAGKRPEALGGLVAGLMGGVGATLALDLVRLPLAHLVKAVPDHVPAIGQAWLGEAAGLAPSWQAVAVGYGCHYLLVGALLGAAVMLVKRA